MKKSSKIIIIFGVILIIIGLLFYFSSEKTITIYKTEKIFLKNFQIEFPIFDDMKNDLLSKNSKSYISKDEKIIINAFSYDSEIKLEEELKIHIEDYKNENAQVFSDEVVENEKLLIHKVKYSENDNLFICGLELSKNNYAFIVYINKGNQFDDKKILSLVNQIKVTNNIEFIIGNEKDNQLIIPLRLHDRGVLVAEFHVKLDKSKYKEIYSEINNYNITTIKNLNNNTITHIHFYEKTLEEFKTYLFDLKNHEYKNIMLKDLESKFLNYNGINYYLIPIKENFYFVLESKDDIENQIINDFLNYELK